MLQLLLGGKAFCGLRSHQSSTWVKHSQKEETGRVYPVTEVPGRG